MKEKIEVIIKTVEERMQSDALVLEKLKKLKTDLEKSEIMPTGFWEDVSEFTAEKRCSNCGGTQIPTPHCHSCGSKNTHRQNG